MLVGYTSLVRRLSPGSAAVLALAILIAFAVRVIPAYNVVMTASGVNFQDNDSWYHMRSIHNVAGHFPHQSGFDPYAVFPGRQDSHSEPWDVFTAAVACLLAFGKPSDWLVDHVGAWLPAVLGALLPLPLFFLTRRLFGDTPARWTALVTGVIPGTLLWETHLGVPDHHVAECLLSVCALVLLCSAVESAGRARLWRIVVSGLLFGTYLCVRPAGIFVPATLALAALFEPLLAPFIATGLGIAAFVFLASSGSIWESYTWLTLASSIAVCLLAWGLGVFWRKREWPRALLLPAAAIAAGIAIGIVAAVEPAIFAAMTERIRMYLPGSHSVARSYSVAELLPIWEVPPGGLNSIFEALGGVWLPAFPVLLCAPWVIWRSRRPALVLCAVWGVVMTVAGVLQMRMWAYGGPALAVAAGVGCAWVMARIPFFRAAISLATAAFLLAISLGHGEHLTAHDGGPPADWRQALTWLRRNTPEPLGDPGAWSRYWPALRPGENFAYPPSAYGVLTWWDYGDWVNAIAHRLPSTNGTQTNAEAVAAFLTATSPDAAERPRAILLARYAVLNSEVTSELWHVLARLARHDPRQFERGVSVTDPDGRRHTLTIYLPDYYRAMAVHMYNFDGRAIVAAPAVSVFTTKRTPAGSGPDLETLVGGGGGGGGGEQRFPSEQEAVQFAQRKSIQLNPGESLIFGSLNPMVSCVNVEELPGVRRVFCLSRTGRAADG